MKKLLCIVICVIMMFTLCSCDDTIYIEKGTYGENINWTLDDEGTLVLSGKGRMINKEVPWSDIKGDIRTVIVKKGITSICDSAFSECRNLSNAEIADSVTDIGKWAFYKCNKLQNINFPDTISQIGKEAFYYCTTLETIELPQNITEIDEGTFFGTKMTCIVIPEGVTEINGQAFGEEVTEIYIPKTVQRIGMDAFDSIRMHLWAYESEVDDLKNIDIYYSGSESEWNSIDATGRYYSAENWGEIDLSDEEVTVHYNNKW